MKKFFYILICFFFISGCFPNERKEVTECKLEIEKAGKIRNSFGYIETSVTQKLLKSYSGLLS